MYNSLKNTPYFVFLFLLIFAPFAFGLDELWALTIAEVFCYIATFLYFCNRENRKNIYRVPGIVPLLLLVICILLQIIPLPAEVIGIVSPATLRLYKETIGSVDMSEWITFSINPRSTLEEFFRISTYVIFYVLAVQLLTDSKRLRKTVFILLGFCVFFSLQAILQKYLDNGRIYWLWPAPPHSSFTGSYVYHNHFAGYVEMLIPVTIALFLRYRPLVQYGDSWRQRIVYMLNHLQFNTHMLLGIAAVVMSVSIFVSMSRGGMLSFMLSCLILLIILGRRARGSSSIYWGLALLTMLFLAVSWFGWDVIDQRFGMIFDQSGNLQEFRPHIWHDSVGIIKDFPLFGTGWGTFGNIFPSYMTFFYRIFMYHAHNDYIETLINGGILSLGLLGWFFVAVSKRIFKALVKRKSSFSVYLTWGSLAGILAILIHSFLDFNLQNGANGLYFFFLIALAVSASHTHSHGNKVTMLAPEKSNVFRYVIIFCSGVLLIASLVINSSSIWANRQLVGLTPFNWGEVRSEIETLNYVDQIKKRTLPVSSFNSYTWASRNFVALMPVKWHKNTSKEELKDIIADLDTIRSLSPLNSYIYFLIAEAQKILGNEEAVSQNYKKAIRLNPAQATYLQSYGLFLAAHGEQSSADSLMRAGIRHAISIPFYKLNYARFLINENEKEKVLPIMRAIFKQHPEKAAEYITFFVDSGFTDEDIRLNLPDRLVPYLKFADYLSKKGDKDQAAALYRQALAYADKEENLRPYYFHGISEFFIKQERYEEALDVIIQAIKFFPADAWLRVRAGNLYQYMGLTHRATEEYQQALSLDPENSEAIKQLSILQRSLH